eukprot:Pgem_evm1s5425
MGFLDYILCYDSDYIVLGGNNLIIDNTFMRGKGRFWNRIAAYNKLHGLHEYSCVGDQDFDEYFSDGEIDSDSYDLDNNTDNNNNTAAEDRNKYSFQLLRHCQVLGIDYILVLMSSVLESDYRKQTNFGIKRLIKSLDNNCTTINDIIQNQCKNDVELINKVKGEISIVHEMFLFQAVYCPERQCFVSFSECLRPDELDKRNMSRFESNNIFLKYDGYSNEHSPWKARELAKGYLDFSQGKANIDKESPPNVTLALHPIKHMDYIYNIELKRICSMKTKKEQWAKIKELSK